MLIRQETAKDFTEIYELVKTAFETAKVADGDEQDYVIKLRNSPNYIPELALVLVENERIIGHIMFTRMFVTSHDKQFEALLLSPVCMELEYRNQGIGSSFIRQSLQKAREKGFKAVFLVGDPAYYQRFGFKTTTHFGIKDTGSIPEQYIMALELEEGILKTHAGTISIC